MLPHNTPAREFFYNLTSVPQSNVNNRTFPVANGCVVGGGSPVNGQFFDRGSRSDYDNWAKFDGNAGWDWNGILPYFKKSVTFTPPTKEMQDFGITYDVEAAWGGNTPIFASYPPYQYPGQKIQWDAWAMKEGVEVQKEHADGHAYGLFWVPTSMEPMSYNRSFSGMGHWIKVPPRNNFHLLTEHKVLHVNFVKGMDTSLPHAKSVSIRARYGNGTTFRVKAKQEIILSAAAVRTPQILQLSGIGPKKLLDTAKIPVLVDLPGVGWNLQDHAFSTTIYNFTNDVFPNPMTIDRNETFRAEAMELWEKNRTGPYAFYVVSSAVFLPASTFFQNQTPSLISEIRAQAPAAYLPSDLPHELIAGYEKQRDILLSALETNTSAVLEHLFQGSARGTVINLKPFSRGTITINSSSPTSEPIFDYRLLSNPIDLKIIVKMNQYMRQHYATSPILAPLSPVEISPGVNVRSDEQVAEWLVNGGHLLASNGHSCCTAAMMPRSLGGVVDGELKVHGVRGLSVADNSIIPLIPGTHTQSTAYAIGEKVSKSDIAF